MPWLSITVMAPLVAAGMLLVIPAASKGAVRVVSAVASLVALWGALEVGFAYDLHEGGIQLRESFPLVPSLGINWDLAVDGWGVSLLLLTGLIL